MKILVLDDSVERHHRFKRHLDGATIDQVWTADEAYRRFRHEHYDVIFLDHDLEMSGDNCGSGTEVVTAMAVLLRMGVYPSAGAIHCVHSANPERAEYMFKILDEAGLTTRRCTEAWNEEQHLNRLAATGEWTFPERWTDPLRFDTPE